MAVGSMIPSFLRTPGRRIRPRYAGDPTGEDYGPTLAPRFGPDQPQMSDAVYRYGRDDVNGPPGMAGVQPIPNYDPRNPGRMELLSGQGQAPGARYVPGSMGQAADDIVASMGDGPAIRTSATPIAAAPIMPRFDPSTAPTIATAAGLGPEDLARFGSDVPPGYVTPRMPRVTTDLKGVPHDVGLPIGAPREIGALPAGIDPNAGSAPLTDDVLKPRGMDVYDQLGLAHASRLDPHAAAEAELGPERKLGGWGKALQIAMGVLSGMQGTQIPEEFTPMGRHKIYEAELGKREADIADRYKMADEQMLEPERARLARQQAEMGDLQVQQARATIDYTNRRNAGELTPDQKIDNRRQALGMGAPVTQDDVALLQLPPDWVGKPLPPYARRPEKPDPARFRDVRNPDGSTSVMLIGDDSKLYPAQYGNGGGPVTGAATPRRDPTAKPRARSAFLSQFATTPEGKSAYEKSYSDALASAVDPGADVELTPQGIDTELSRLQGRIRALDDAGRAGPGIPGDVAGMDPAEAAKEQERLRAKYRMLAGAKHRADVEARKAVDDAAGRKFDETYTGDEGQTAGGGDFAGVSRAEFEAHAAQAGVQPGTPEYAQALQTFLAGGGSEK